MILFDQLRISDDGKRLYINAHVNKADYFANVYIDSIVIMTADKVSETAPGTVSLVIMNCLLRVNIKWLSSRLSCGRLDHCSLAAWCREHHFASELWWPPCGETMALFVYILKMKVSS